MENKPQSKGVFPGPGASPNPKCLESLGLETHRWIPIPIPQGWNIPVPVGSLGQSNPFAFLLELRGNPRKFNPGGRIPWNLSQIGQKVEKPKRRRGQNPQKIWIKAKIMELLLNCRWKNQSDEGTATLRKSG